MTRPREEPGLATRPDGQDDSQGKQRSFEGRRRLSLLLVAFIVGITFGVVISERVYIESNRPEGSIPTNSHRAGKVAPVSTEGTHRVLTDNAVRGRIRALGAIGGSANVGSQALAGVASRPGCRAVDGNCALEAYLRQVAPQGEVLVAISNYALVQWGGMLNTWIERVQRAKVPNYLVLAIDEELHKHLEDRGVPNFYLKAEIAAVQQGTGSNHAVSALKFGILKEFLKLGWHVLLSDVDVVTLQNPFDHLYRDRDVEGMSDGFDDATAYGHIDGFDDPSMGWARYAQATKHFNLNSGLFYVRANVNTIALMAKLEDRLSRQKYWDQAAFNEEIFFLSHGDTAYVPITVRVLDYWKFQNSKVFFKRWRHEPAGSRVKPVMVHLNYHPDKDTRMKGIIEYFDTGNANAIMKWPGGSEPGS